MTNQHETPRELLLRLKTAADFEPLLFQIPAPVDQLPAALGEPDLRRRLGEIAARVFPIHERNPVGPFDPDLVLCRHDPLDLDRLKESLRRFNNGERQRFSACLDEMLRRLAAGYSAPTEPLLPAGEAEAEVKTEAIKQIVAARFARLDEALEDLSHLRSLAGPKAAATPELAPAPAAGQPAPVSVAPAAAELPESLAPANAGVTADSPSSQSVAEVEPESQARSAPPLPRGEEAGATGHEPAPQSLAMGWIQEGRSLSWIAKRLGMRRQDIYEKTEWATVHHLWKVSRCAWRQARDDRRRRGSGQFPDSSEI